MSEKIRYATIIYMYVNEFKGVQNNIAISFKVDKSTISKYKKNIDGKSQLKKEISKEKFYSTIFSTESETCNDKIKINKENIDIIYTFLNKNNFFLSEESVKRYKTNDYEGFVKALIDEAEDSRNADLKGNGLKDHYIEENIKEIIELHNTDFAKENFSNFIGRVDKLNEIENKLNEYSYAIICGMGGMGKSKCAQKYAVDSAKNKYNRIQQVYFDNDLATTILNIKFDGQNEEYSSEKEHLKTNLRILKELDETSLLIIDNFDQEPNNDDREILKELIDCRMHILITTRNLNMDNKKYLIAISKLSFNEQVELFEKHYAELDDETINSLKEILKLIEGHTMLIEMIAKTMYDNSMTVDEMYKSLLTANDDNVSKIPIIKDNEYENNKIYSYISKLFDINNIDEIGKKILVNLSLSGVSGIRLRLLKLYLLENGNLEPVNSLVDRSWIIRESMTPPINNRVHLHTAIRTAVIKTLNPSLDNVRNYLESVIEICNTNDKEINQEDKHDMRMIILYASSLFINEYSYMDIEFLVKQAKILDKSSDSSRDLTVSLTLYQKCIDLISERKESNIDIRVFNYYLNCGDIYTKLTDNNNAYEHAICSYQNAIKGYSMTENYEGLAKAYNKLGNIYRKTSKYDNSKGAFEKALKIIDEKRIENPTLKSDILNNYGILFINIDEYDQSLKHYLAAKDIRESLPDSDEKAISLAYSYQNIGTAYQRKKDYSKAILWHKKALDLRENIFSDDNPVLAESLNMIGNDIVEAYKDNQKDANMDIAKNHLEKALHLRVTKLGSMHTSTAWSHQSIAKWYLCMNMYKEAISHLNKCLNIRNEILGKNHKYTGEALYWLGVAYMKIKDIELAKQHFIDAANIQKELGLNIDYERTISSLESLPE